ncbi:MAG: recombinase family protein [Bdellovibrionales bacterium]|nr:recombinase family protein [Bdellovibrionales bacterium]
MKRYFAYIRVSTIRQGEHGSSLQEQRRAIEAYAARLNLSIVSWFEERETAAKSGRAVFAGMLSKLEKGHADGVLIHKIDRSARNLRDWAKLGELIDRGIDVHFAHDNVDLHSRGGRLSADIQAVVAADYIRNLREEVLKGQRGRLSQGIYPFGAPVGYLNTGKGRLKAIDPERAPLVRQAFELYATGTIGLKGLRAEMKRRGLTSLRSGKPLSLNALSLMLNNPFYMGTIYIRRSRQTFKGNHEPIVSALLYERVRAILHGKLVIRLVKHDFTFRKLVKCTGCGLNLIGEQKKGRYTYYRCQSPTCKGTNVREEVLDNLVQTNLALLAWRNQERDFALATAAKELATADDQLERLRATLTLQAAKLDDRLIRLTDAYLDQAIDKEMFERRKQALLAEQAELRDQLAGLSSDDLPINRAFNYLELGDAAYSGYVTASPAERRSLVQSVTSNFTLSRKEPAFTLLSPYQEIANCRKLELCADVRAIPRTYIMQLLDIVVAFDTASRKAPPGSVKGMLPLSTDERHLHI